MNIKGFSFIELDNDKTPVNKKPYKNTLNYYDAKECENLGLVLREPFVVIDVDDSASAQKMLNYCKSFNIHTAVLKTTRGMHFWFKSEKPLANLTHIQNAIGIQCDIRSYGRQGFVMVKKNGVWREWLNEIEIEELDIIPKELIPISDKLLNEVPSLASIDKVGDGRREALFKRIIPLANNGFTKFELVELFKKINQVMFLQPLSKNELDNLFTDDSIFEWKPKFDDYFSDESHSFLHYKFASDLQKFLHGYYNEKTKQYFVFNGKFYTSEERYLFQKMNEIIPSLKQAQRQETLFYLKSTKDSEVLKSNEYVVALKNGIYDFKNNIFQPHSHEYFITNLINCEYNYSIQSHPVVDSFLNEITCGDLNLRYVLEEMLGYCFISNTCAQKAFILKGYGANGKSTFLDVIKELIGLQNLSAVGLDEFSERFKRAALVDKLVNVSSELPNTGIDNLKIFKQLVTGDLVDAEFKGKNSFNFINTAKLIFSANELPKMNDTTEGFIRRLLIIPFNNYFSESKRDGDMLKKLTTEEAKSYWFNLAILGWNRLSRNNNVFTKSNLIEEEMTKWINSMNSIRRWFASPSFKIANYFEKTVNQMYVNYQQFCVQNNNGKHMNVWKLKEELLIKFKNIEIDDKEVIHEKQEDEWLEHCKKIFESEEWKCLDE